MDKIIGKQLPKKDQDNEHWVSMSDQIGRAHV